MRRYRALDRGVDVSRLKISQDPLFGLTVYEMAGLFFETVWPVAAFCAREPEFSQLALNGLYSRSRALLGESLVARLFRLEAGYYGPPTPTVDKFLQFIAAIQAQPRHAGACIHLVAGRWPRGRYESEAAQVEQALAGSSRLRLHYTPWGSRWRDLMARWLTTISVWPLQSGFVASVERIGGLLNGASTNATTADTIVIC